MKKIVAYEVVAVHDVSGYVKEGWQPWGSPVATVAGREVCLYQAIVMYEER